MTHDYLKILENTPDELKQLPVFVCWKIGIIDGKQTKIPINPLTLGMAETNNSSTWTHLDKAIDVASRENLGVGFVITKENGIVGIDIDNGQENVEDILGLFNSYTEKSPSGNGYHILLRAIKNFEGNRKGKLETYDNLRYFTLTGNVVNNKHQILNEQLAYDQFGHTYFPPKIKPVKQSVPLSDLDDKKILELAFNARNGHSIQKLYNGDSSSYDNDISKADSALAFHLAFYTNDEQQIERLMRSSGRNRDKWDIHPTYLANTIKKAIDGVTEGYQKPMPIILPETIGYKSNNHYQSPQIEKKIVPAILKREENKPVRVKGIPIEAWSQIFDYLGYDFRLNLLADDVEVNGEPITDIWEAVIRNRLGEFGVFGKDLISDAIIRIAQENKYNPIKSYLENLKPNTTAIKTLCKYFTDKTNNFEFVFTKWIVGAVAKVYVSTENKTLVLNGEQRLGKSYFIRWLGSAAGRKYHTESNLNPNDKDTLIYMTKKWIWEIAEMGGLIGKSGATEIKTLLTRENITVRKSYGKHEIHKKALTSFAGTVNDISGFLNDPTGSTRFLITTLENIDYEYSRVLTPDDIWANAYQLYKSGFSWKLTKEEQIKSEIDNQEYREVDPICEAILELFVIEPDNDQISLSYSKVEKKLRDYGYISHNNPGTAIGNAMASLGVTKTRSMINGNKVTLYQGVRIKE